ncbi:hypothetical protein EIP91_003694 [Steccherinum ochraceum]|uniref:SnoaL-like domain-containing protein n=1 Tax=Steccherinum ochraceum TaxID=92696 RepID=A0A4R0RLN7_9APHY|nr:hypothetical protein EIP91_003694 [Steccherinum ochraceum]
MEADDPPPTPSPSRSPECDCGITGNYGSDDWDSFSPQRQTVFTFIQALRDSNYEILDQTLSEDFMFEILPRSLGIPMRRKDEWLKTCRSSNILEPGYRVDVIDINESPGRIWIHATIFARAKTGQSYENEYMLMFRLAENSAGEPKITWLREFMDSLYTTHFANDVGGRSLKKMCDLPSSKP